MVLLILVYLLIFGYEWMFARRKQMDRRSITIVMILLVCGFLYAAIQIVYPYSLTPNPLLQEAFRPLSHMIWRE
ncbi:MAG: hypothetical protein K0R75_203 [Paenibacillaceae bacterium]|nr:hypothetical protein [Paenibacillaceae bacterium]